MREYRTLYKCRLCGERYIGGVTKSRKVAIKEAAYAANNEILEPNSPALIEPHICKDNGIGIADFQGFEEVEI